jgi:excisionase family DNA binding protein
MQQPSSPIEDGVEASGDGEDHGAQVDRRLTLHQAAHRLGVHYMTAYRYVRLGLLAAHKEGGTWRVSPADLDAFIERATAPPVPGEDLAGGRRRAPWARRLEDRLLAGDAAGAWGVIEASMAAGTELEDVYLDVLTPAMWSIGTRWESGDIDVADEHRATAIAMRLIGRLGPRFARRGRSRGTVMLANPQGERHAMGLAVVGDLLRAAGFQVSELGADVPHESLARAAQSVDDLVAVGLSISTEDHVAEAEAAIAELRAGGVTVPVVVGGHGVVAGARVAGADVTAADARDLVRVMEELAGR